MIPALSARFPRTVATLDEPALEHVLTLERAFAGRRRSVAIGAGDAGAGEPEFDVALAGGGLSLVYGAWLARAGFRVVVFDRGRVGRGHREWNISRGELAPLTRSGLFTDEEVARLVLLQYRHGIVRWHGGGTYAVRGVLDCVIDAQGLLDRLRARAEAAGATILDGHAWVGYRVSRSGVAIDLAERTFASRPRTLTARLLLDGTGAGSPHAAFDLACPTVGGVLAGLDEGDAPDLVDPTVGEILISTEGVEERRQHIWEGFPGPDHRFTVYLFYYAEPDTLGEHPLLELYERFFRLRPRYKRGEARFEKPTYGFIPAYTRLRSTPASPSDRVLLVGDAAGRHSPLTFCGFGAMVRSFLPVAEGVRGCLVDDRLSQRALAALWREPAGLRVMGGLTLMMIPGDGRGGAGPASGDALARDPGAINRLLDAAFATLAELGQDTYAAFVRDEIGARDFLRFMTRTARRHPSIYREVFAQLTPAEIASWTRQMLALAAGKWRTG